MECLRLESHLKGCRGCRRHHRQMESTVGMVRHLETVEAPRFSLHRLRPGNASPADRRARWERIRAGRLAPPRPMLRPVAFAALALMLVVAVLQSLDRVAPPAPGDGAPEPDRVARIPAERPGVPPEELDDSVKREIARRVLQARERESASTSQDPADDAPGTSVPPDGEPLRIADLGGAADPEESRAPLDGGETPPPAAGSSPAAPDPVRLAPPPEAGTRIARQAPASPPDSPGGDAPAATGIIATNLVIGSGQPVAESEPSPAGEPPAPARPSTGARGVRRAEPPAEPEEDPAAEIADAYHMVAVLGADSSATVSFLDPDEYAAALESGGRRIREDGESESVVPTELEPLAPEPDPDTGITRPVVTERPGVDLGSLAGKVRERGLLAPLVLTVRVTTAGEVADLVVNETTGMASLDRLLVEAVEGWTFRPAEDAGGRPVPAVLELVMEVDLDAPRL